MWLLAKATSFVGDRCKGIIGGIISGSRSALSGLFLRCSVHATTVILLTSPKWSEVSDSITSLSLWNPSTTLCYGWISFVATENVCTVLVCKPLQFASKKLYESFPFQAIVLLFTPFTRLSSINLVNNFFFFASHSFINCLADQIVSFKNDKGCVL